MNQKYCRLTYQNRIGIYYLLKQGMSFRAIARQLDVSPSTISREVRRNRSGSKYFPNTAQRKTRKRQLKLPKKIDNNPKLKKLIYQGLRKQWSPEQIASRLKIKFNDLNMHVSPETIYTHLYVLPRGALKKSC
jgi:IS30 family transposase